MEMQYEGKLNFATRSDLLVNFRSANIGLKIEGWSREDSVMEIKIFFRSKKDEAFDPKSLIKSTYDDKKNELNLEIPDLDEIKDLDAELVFKIPQTSEINAELINAPLRITGLHGIQTVKTKNGQVKILDIDGDIFLSTENGPIYLNQIKGNIHLDAENSPVKISESAGNVKIKLENGILKLIDSSGKLQVNAVNGPVRILNARFEKAAIENINGQIYYEFGELEQGEFSLCNKQGKINVIIPDSIQYDISARNRLGKISIGLDGEYEQEREGDQYHLQMLKGTGKVEIRIENQLGGISILNSPVNNDVHVDFKDAFDRIMEKIPEDIKEKVRSSITQVKGELEDINFSEIEDKMQKGFKNIETTISDELKKDKYQHMADKIKDNVNQIIERIKIHKNQSDSSEEQNNDLQRKKILKMLEEGKITVEQAEKLLLALESKK
ncbi:MAG: hypothetical protein JW996_01960 [Candidatus Cloacimonetes bacterium]|nr:hypothetical protein [Candidatus Cloacimonadota bacterium]